MNDFVFSLSSVALWNGKWKIMFPYKYDNKKKVALSEPPKNVPQITLSEDKTNVSYQSTPYYIILYRIEAFNLELLERARFNIVEVQGHRGYAHIHLYHNSI